jgi:hypothetical protein
MFLAYFELLICNGQYIQSGVNWREELMCVDGIQANKIMISASADQR